MRRIPAWRSALFAEIEAHRRQPFLLGERDCALFSANGVRAMTGDDLAAGFRGRYRTAAGARRVLTKAGYADHVALAASLLPEIPPSRASAGDVAAVVEEGGTTALGIVTGAEIAVCTPAGIGFVELAKASRAFRVG